MRFLKRRAHTYDRPVCEHSAEIATRLERMRLSPRTPVDDENHEFDAGYDAGLNDAISAVLGMRDRQPRILVGTRLRYELEEAIRQAKNNAPFDLATMETDPYHGGYIDGLHAASEISIRLAGR